MVWNEKRWKGKEKRMRRIGKNGIGENTREGMKNCMRKRRRKVEWKRRENEKNGKDWNMIEEKRKRRMNMKE